MVEAMYENTKGRVVVGSSMSKELQVNMGLRQGSALRPFFFIFIMELISRKISKTDALRKIMYADGFVIVAERGEEWQGALEDWNDLSKKNRPIFFFCRVLRTIFSHLRAHAFARSVTVARSSAVQASSSRRHERRWAIV